MTIEDVKKDNAIGESVRDSIVEWMAPLDGDAEFGRTLEGHHKRVVRRLSFILGCIVVTLVVMSLAITYGSYDIGFFEAYEIIWDHIMGTVQDEMKDRVVIDLRLPRIVGGMVAGIALALCGVVLQSVLKNPLADPYTTGVSSGGSLGAVLAITLGLQILSAEWNMVILAFVFSMIPIGLMVAVSQIKNSSPTTVIMAGLGVMYVFNAITTVMMLLTDPNNLARVYRWQVGTLDLVAWSGVLPMAVVTVVGLLVIVLYSKRLNLISTGDENARGMGLDVERTRTVLLVVVGMITATIVSFTGLIGFVGLVVPHIARLFIGADNRYLIPASAALGSATLVIADLIGRWVLAPTVLQVGVIMSFIGGPVFIWLILRRNNALWR